MSADMSMDENFFDSQNNEEAMLNMDNIKPQDVESGSYEGLNMDDAEDIEDENGDEDNEENDANIDNDDEENESADDNAEGDEDEDEEGEGEGEGEDAEEDEDVDMEEEDGEEDGDDAKEGKYASPNNGSKQGSSEAKDGDDSGTQEKPAPEADQAKSSDLNGERDTHAGKDGESDTKEEGVKLSTEQIRENLIVKAKEAKEFDIIPSVAIPYASECHAIAFTDGPQWIITGGEDGFIRKYNFIASVEGKSPLTVAQKHNLVDSVTKAGVISSYWENEQPKTKSGIMKSNPKIKESDFNTGSALYEPEVNPVYALDVERNGYWCLSGLSSGGISLYTMRYNEGAIHYYFNHGQKKQNHSLDNGHNDAVSVIKLNTEQDKMLSGSWDKTIRQWDLNTGKCTNLFLGSSGQISTIQYRPSGLVDLSISVQEGDNQEDNSDMDSLFGESDENDNENEAEKDRAAQEKQDKTSTSKQERSSKTTKTYSNDSVFMSSSIDGTINIWDARASNYNPVLRLGVTDGVPPWCMSATWSNCGEYIYAGRRNSTVEEFSIKAPHRRSKTGHMKDTMVPNVLKTLLFPKISGPVSAISTVPSNNFLLCGSSDNIRLYNLKLYDDFQATSTNKKLQATPFLIIPGHHGGILSSLYVDDTGRFMVSASGNRGWGHASFTDTVLIYEIDILN